MEIKVFREPLLPPIPEEDDANDLELERNWRKGHATALVDLHRKLRETLERGGFRIEERTPANAADYGEKGMLSYDANYFYVCYANNAWARFALTW